MINPEDTKVIKKLAISCIHQVMRDLNVEDSIETTTSKKYREIELYINRIFDIINRELEENQINKIYVVGSTPRDKSGCFKDIVSYNPEDYQEKKRK